MIRTVTIPTRVNRIGLVQAGAGGSAGSYTFNPQTGLSNDPQLAYYLQDLTPPQLQNALNGNSPNADLIHLLNDEQTGTGAGSLPCGTTESGDPNCNGGQPVGGGILNSLLPSLASIPTWVWVASAGTIAAVLLIPRK